MQGFAQTAMKRNMIAGDEEYKEPNKSCTRIQPLVVVTVIVLLAVMLIFSESVMVYENNNIKQLRKAAGLRQEDISKNVG